MRLSPSAHLDTFCRDRLPPSDQWPEFRFGLPELNYPERLNCAAELLDATAASVGYARGCLSSPAGTWTYGQTIRQTNQLAQVLTEDFGLRPGNRVLLRGHRLGPLPLRWVYLHALREFAQHCGHADILREQILSGRSTPASGLPA